MRLALTAVPRRLALTQGFGIIDGGLASRYQDEAIGEGAKRYRGRFKLMGATMGDPVYSQSVRVRSTSGQYITGRTDADGYTQWIEREASEALAFDLVQEVTHDRSIERSAKWEATARGRRHVPVR